MDTIMKNDSKSFRHIQGRFILEAGKLFEKEHQGRECTNAVVIRVLFCALGSEIQPFPPPPEKLTGRLYCRTPLDWYSFCGLCVKRFQHKDHKGMHKVYRDNSKVHGVVR